MICGTLCRLQRTACAGKQPALSRAYLNFSQMRQERRTQRCACLIHIHIEHLDFLLVCFFLLLLYLIALQSRLPNRSNCSLPFVDISLQSLPLDLDTLRSPICILRRGLQAHRHSFISTSPIAEGASRHPSWHERQVTHIPLYGRWPSQRLLDNLIQNGYVARK